MSKAILGRHALHALADKLDLKTICHAEIEFRLDDAARLKVELILTKDQLKALTDSLCNGQEIHSQSGLR